MARRRRPCSQGELASICINPVAQSRCWHVSERPAGLSSSTRRARLRARALAARRISANRKGTNPQSGFASRNAAGGAEVSTNCGRGTWRARQEVACRLRDWEQRFLIDATLRSAQPAGSCPLAVSPACAAPQLPPAADPPQRFAHLLPTTAAYWGPGTVQDVALLKKACLPARCRRCGECRRALWPSWPCSLERTCTPPSRLTSVRAAGRQTP